MLKPVIIGAAIAATLLLIAIVYERFFGECAGAPKFVTFHQGMTLCPGQTATYGGDFE
jgi:hypothetical protein